DNSGVDVFLKGPIKVSGGIDPVLPLYIENFPTSGNSNNTIDLFIEGFYDTEILNVPLFIQSRQSGVKDIPLFLDCIQDSSGNLPLYIHGTGHFDLSNSFDLFISGFYDISSGIIPLFVKQFEPYNSFSESGSIVSLFLESYVNNSGSLPLYIHGSGHADIFNSHTLYISGTPWPTGGIDLYLAGPSGIDHTGTT